MNQKLKQIYLFVILVSATGLGFSSGSPLALQAPSLETIELPGGIRVDLLLTESCSRHLLVLPGYRHSRKRMQKETALLSELKARKYCAALPGMKREVYASSWFRETRLKQLPVPAPVWFEKHFWPAMKSRGLFTEPEKNFALGISTGGRGVVQLAIWNRNRFRAVAAFSGDFNQAAMPKDRLMTLVYGPFRKYKKRWKSIDNPYSGARSWEVPIFLGHGRQDRVVPFQQSSQFLGTVKQFTDVPTGSCFPEKGKHNYRTWNQCLVPMFRFFDSIR